MKMHFILDKFDAIKHCNNLNSSICKCFEFEFHIWIVYLPNLYYKTEFKTFDQGPQLDQTFRFSILVMENIKLNLLILTASK